MSRPAIKTEALAGRIRQTLSNLTVSEMSLKALKTQFGFKPDPVNLFTDSLRLALMDSGFERRGRSIVRIVGLKKDNRSYSSWLPTATTEPDALPESEGIELEVAPPVMVKKEPETPKLAPWVPPKPGEVVRGLSPAEQSALIKRTTG